MQTELSELIRDTSQGREADAILRSCVHCGFCLSACPTYRLLGDELDSPRGRIYLMKQLLEGQSASAVTQLHLDRCLTCRACESACPSGVQYGRLLDIGRSVLEQRVPRSGIAAAERRLLRAVLPYRRRFAALLAIARALRPLLPRALRARLPAQPARSAAQRRPAWPAARHARRVVLLDGCVQAALEPGINTAAAQVLDRLGISALRTDAAGCCGAVAQHLTAHEEALAAMRRNVDALWPLVQSGVEAIGVTASACASMVSEYGRLLREEPQYAQRAARVSAICRDISQLLSAEAPALAQALARAAQGASSAAPVRVAFHSPCTLQHALKITGSVEPLLAAAGYTLTTVTEGQLCCGSAGTYSILQPELSQQLLAAKCRALTQDVPDVIATANIGCLEHLRTGTAVPVRHWIELIAERIS